VVALSQLAAGRAESEAFRRRAMRFGALVALVVSICLACVTYVGVGWYFTSQAWPGEVAAHAAAVNSHYDGIAANLTAEFDAYEAEQQSNVSEYRRSPNMTSSDVERAVARVESRIARHRAESQAALAEAQLERDAQLDDLSDDRVAEARSMAVSYSPIVGGGVFLLGLLLARFWSGRED